MTRLTHLDLDLLFEHALNGYQVRVLRSPAGDGQLVAFPRPFSDLELENFVLKVGKFRTARGRVEAAPVAAAKQVGARLFDSVFVDAVGDCLHRSMDRARDQGALLRIRLRLSSCPELSDLPWELLYDRSDDWFLALSARTPVVRYVQLPDPPRALHVTLPLRILVIRSEPVDFPQLDLEGEWAQVAAALGELTDAGLIAFSELAAPTLSELRRALQRDTFHGLHYMGHGDFNQQGGALMFTDRRGRAVPVTGGDLGVMLRDHTSMRLAVLNACEGARTDPADPFAGVADTLVRRGIPAVIAMQFGFSDEAAIEFAPALYGALAAGRPVDAAVAEARKAIYAISSLEWATPVLYLRAEDAQLFDVASPTPPSSTSAAPNPLAKGPKLNPADACVQEGDSHYQERRYANAEAAYREAIRLDSTLASARNGLGYTLRDQRRYPEAEAAFREAIRLDPGLGVARNGLGKVLRDLKRYPEAEAACREAIRLDPDHAPAHSTLGFVLCMLRRYPEAEAACREAIRLDPDYAPARTNLGILMTRLERYPEAEAACREAIRLAPDYPGAHVNLANLLRSLKRYPEAEAAAREAIRLDPGYATARVHLGVVLNALQRYPEAEASYREAIRLEPKYTSAHLNLGSLLYSQQRYTEAESAFKEAIRLDPTSASSHNDLGAVLYSQKRYPEAEAAYKEAVRLDPTLTTAQSMLSDLQRRH